MANTSQLPAGWIKATRTADGRPTHVLAPSKTKPGKYHLVSREACDCQGFRHRRYCSHLHTLRLAIRLARNAEVMAYHDRQAEEHAGRLALGWDRLDAERQAIGDQPIRVPLVRIV